MRLTWIFVALAAVFAGLPAQAAEIYIICVTWKGDNDTVRSDMIVLPQMPPYDEYLKRVEELKTQEQNNGKNVNCFWKRTKEEVLQIKLSGVGEWKSVSSTGIDGPFTQRASTILTGNNSALKVQKLDLYWQNGRRGIEGHQSASIGLSYAFLQCAGEIQIAYAINRLSFKASDNYYFPKEDAFRKVPPPAAPSTVHLRGTVRLSEFDNRVIANIDDKFAGEALGMGCFDGQTKKLGTVAQLVGPGATADQVKSFLAALKFRPSDYLPGSFVQAGLTASSNAPAVSKVAAPRDAADEHRRLIEESIVRDRQMVEENKRNEAANIARLKAFYGQSQAAEATANREYQQKLQTYQADLARNRAAQAAYEVKMRRWRACAGGDATQCD